MVKSVKARVESERKVRTPKKSAPIHRTKTVATPKYESESINMFTAYRAFWARGFTDWTGTTSRAEYWWTVLANLLIVGGMFALMWLTSINGISNEVEAFAGIILLGMVALYGFASLVPSMSMIVRRLRDGGFSPWWVLLYPAGLWVPYIGYVATVVLFIFMLMPARAGGQK